MTDGTRVPLPKQNNLLNVNLLGHYAGFVSRVVAFVIDLLTISISFIVISWFINITMAMLQVKPILNYILGYYPAIVSTISPIIRPITAGISIFIFTVLYHVLLWFFTGKTVGKFVMGLKIVPLSGGRVSLWRAFLRYFGYYVSGIALGLGFFWIIFDRRRMGWHDKLARTCVIYTWSARPDERFLLSATQKIQSRREVIDNRREQQTQSPENPDEPDKIY